MSQIRIKAEAYQAIEKRFTCEHSERELRFRRIADGRPAYYRQCIRCGNAGRAISGKEAKNESGDDRDLPVFDNELEKKWLARKHAEYVKTYLEIRPSLGEEYEAYLLSPEWAERRAAVLARANHICEVCNYFPASQAHHKNYSRIGQEHMSDLLAVCPFCHGILHSRIAL